MKIRQKRCWVCGLNSGLANVVLDHLQLHLQGVHTPDFFDRHPGQHDDHGHLQDELEKVGNQNAPQASDEGVQPGERDQNQHADHESGVTRIPQGVLERMSADRHLQHASLLDDGTEQNRDNAHHRLRHPPQDEAVHEEAQVHRFEPTQKRGRLPAVSDLDELHVGQDLGAPPVTGEEEDGQHSSHTGTPPDPIAGNSLPGDQAGDQQWGVCGERRGDHRGSCQPPGDVAAGDEELFRVATGPPAVIEADQQIDQQVGDDHDPID